MKLFQYTICLRHLFQSHSTRAGVYSASKRIHGLPISSTMQVKDVHLQASNVCNSSHTWKFLLASGGVAATLFLCLHTHAQCQSVSQSKEQTVPLSPSLPLITLYQYQTCPYCSKARAFLEYYGVKYEKVEVNPVFRRETKSFEYRKLPFIVAEGLQVKSLIPRPFINSNQWSGNQTGVLSYFGEDYLWCILNTQDANFILVSGGEDCNGLPSQMDIAAVKD